MIDNDFSKLLALSSLYISHFLADLEKNVERKDKKRRVVERKLKIYNEAFPEITCSLDWPAFNTLLKTLFSKECTKEDEQKLIIDLALSNPFAPYDLTFEKSDLDKALKVLGAQLDLDISSILATRDQAMSAHFQVDLTSIVLWGVGGIIVFGLGGWLAAPLIGTAIGTAAGLSGAAATSHGLAILGGGSLALGGSGMAGGFWLVAGSGVVVGSGLGVGRFLVEIGAAQAKVELIKLQISFKEILMAGQKDMAKAQLAIKKLEEDRSEVLRALDEAKSLNEANSRSIKELESTIKAIDDALLWMKKQNANLKP